MVGRKICGPEQCPGVVVGCLGGGGSVYFRDHPAVGAATADSRIAFGGIFILPRLLVGTTLRTIGGLDQEAGTRFGGPCLSLYAIRSAGTGCCNCTKSLKGYTMSSPITRRDFLKLASVLPLLSLRLPKLAAEASSNLQNPDQQNILIFVFDALSARHMPIFGYPRNTTPNLARFAERATVYHSHHSAGNFTTSGTASLMTGVYPWSHRAIHLYGSTLGSYSDGNIFSIYPQAGYTYAYTHNLLAEFLLQQFQSNIDLFKRTRELAINDPEYSDRLFASDYNVSFSSEQLILRGGETKPSSLFGGLLYRFMRLSQKRKMAGDYETQFPRGIPNLDDVYFILEDAIDWLISELPTARKPSLGYFHVLPPHEPFYPRKDFIGKFQDGFKPVAKPPNLFSAGLTDEFLNEKRVGYDENLAYADAEFGRLYDAILQKKILDDTIVIVTADHGELFERGIVGHITPTLYEPLLHIPLMISVPGQTLRQDIYSHTSCVDLLPTLVKLTGQPAPEWVEGEILPGFRDEPVQNDRSVFAVEAKSSSKQGALKKLTVALIKENYKLIYYRGYPKTPAPELFDLSKDPEELQDLAATKPSIAADLQQEIEGKLRLTNSF
jgi:arylsulfatase A-like enzyme